MTQPETDRWREAAEKVRGAAFTKAACGDGWNPGTLSIELDRLITAALEKAHAEGVGETKALNQSWLAEVNRRATAENRAEAAERERDEAKADAVRATESYIRVGQERDALRAERDALATDARRYRRLQILGVGIGDDVTVSRFTNLDKYVDEDLRLHPSRGEANPVRARTLLGTEGGG